MCSGCGYELTGLAVRGYCPECGQEYDASSGIGLTSHFSARHARGAFIVARIRTIVLALVAVAIFGLGVLASVMMQNAVRPLVIASLIAGVVALAAVASFLYERDEG